MSERLEHPTREQLAGMDDPDDLQDLADAFDEAIAGIEASLEFRDGTSSPDWERRAIDALAHHRFTKRLIEHRLKAVGPPRTVNGGLRPDYAYHPLSSELLGGWCVDPKELATVEAVVRAADDLADRINALAADRDDEKAKVAEVRDYAFLNRAETALRDAATLRSRLQDRRGVLTRAEKMQAQASQERRFIEAARVMLDRDTYLAIWDKAKEST